MTPAYNPDQLDTDPVSYYRNKLRWTIPQAAMNPAGSVSGQGGFDPGAPPEDNGWPNQVPLDPAAFRVDTSSSSGPGGLGSSGQPEAPKPSGDISAGAGSVMAQKMPPPGISQPQAQGPPASGDQSWNAPPKLPPPGVTPEIQQQMQGIQQRMQDRAANPPQMIGNRPQDIDPTTGQEKTSAKAESWGQRLAMALLAATKLAPYAQQIVHPDYTQQVAQQATAEGMDEKQMAALEREQNISATGEYRAGLAQARTNEATTKADEDKRKADSDQARAQLKGDEDFTKQIGTDAVTGLDPNDPTIAQLKAQGWHVTDDLRDHREGVPKMQVAIPPRFVTVTPDNASILTGHQVGQLVPWNEYKSSLGEYQKAQAAGKAAANKPPTSESEKLSASGLLQKVAQENNLNAGAMTDVRQLVPLIDKATSITPEEKAHLKTYLAMNPTAAASGAQATVRVEGMQNSREMQVLDTKNNNSPMFLNAADINAANQKEPGRYIPAGVGAQALGKTALLEDIRGGVQNLRQSLQNMPEFTPSDKVLIATALRSTDPKSAISSLINSAAGSAMSPEMQDYLINHATLIENAMAMRSVLGAGHGSDDMRAAISKTIPGPTTPNKAYAMKQLDQFEQTLNRVERGVPKVPLRTDAGQQSALPDPAGLRNLLPKK